ncbi:MAG: hypothetical protein A3J62_01720 [Candidatus Buchananbacteria bacterium RIFCSPHIGHO2_02_FULL_38_8]|uniref:Uncharacterized protein n=2 Tax=Candidatus Buchananiibacteriota TaxID=1817903 RepID=A0A1G1XZK0_9BACT|nr:MAG: hypothetical protein A2731_00400 [Candidatus Buchananbacteria bacterium RIFCSPHIGHO2_01_FULL_39_8]OGY47310.1 MAG: hypothetical protein A3J62_01720 [Candidatus Buchananbacteria bacterium RIFCSPHIGHO2_02_FULL_38_8]
MQIKLTGIIIVVLLIATGGYFFFKGSYQAPSPSPSPTPLSVEFKPGILEEVKAKFTNTTLAVWPDYQKEPFCVSGVVVGKPELGGMGFHAVKPGTSEDQIIDPLEPEIVLVDGKNNIVGIEYMVRADSQPSLFGAGFEATAPEGHPGFEIPHWDLHLWLIDNPAGAFAPFNPNVVCPEGSLPPAPII